MDHEPDQVGRPVNLIIDADYPPLRCETPGRLMEAGSSTSSTLPKKVACVGVVAQIVGGPRMIQGVHAVVSFQRWLGK